MRKVAEVESGSGARVDARGSHSAQGVGARWQWSLPVEYDRPHGEFYLEFGISSHEELVEALRSADFSLSGQVMQACLLFGYIKKTPHLETSSQPHR